MAKEENRKHTRVFLDIWGDDDWLELPADAQLLYLTLYTSPGRTYCGAHEWHVGKICQKAGDWTPDRVIAAAEVLSERLFLVIDETTDECLLRSWIKHDGLWRTPNMAVTVANARADLASKKLRGVVVHEVAKLKNADPGSTSWDRDAVREMLSQRSIDPASLPPFKGGSNGGPNGGGKGGANPTANPCGENGANPTSNPGPTTTTATSLPTTATEGGYVSTEGHQEPPSRCPSHVNHPNPPKCGACADARRAHQAWEDARQADELAARRQIREAADNCPTCGGTNWIPDTEPAVKCHHQEVING